MVLFLDKLAGKLSGFWYQKITLPAMRYRMKCCGENVQIGKWSDITCQNVSIGNNAYLGPGTIILSTRAQVVIGNDVMFGPRVTIITGNHRTDLVGRTMRSATNEEKRPEDDQNVVIEDDVWVGANVTVLKGVTIGTGSVIAAGAVVTKSVPPYSFAAGVPAHVVRKRFSEEDLQKHLQILGNMSQV